MSHFAEFYQANGKTTGRMVRVNLKSVQMVSDHIDNCGLELPMRWDAVDDCMRTNNLYVTASFDDILESLDRGGLAQQFFILSRDASSYVTKGRDIFRSALNIDAVTNYWADGKGGCAVALIGQKGSHRFDESPDEVERRIITGIKIAVPAPQG